MGSVTSDDDAASDQQSDRCGSYCVSADVSESESYSDISYRRYSAGNGAGPSTVASTSHASSPIPTTVSRCAAAAQAVGSVAGMLPEIIGASWGNAKIEKTEPDLSEVDMMKERFAKLLLGEDMSGGGKGVCTALAISNAITNLSATVFGELWRLEPLADQKKAMWRREMEWLLCVSDSIVELVPSIQDLPGGGGAFEVMVPRPRSDLHLNLPALKKLDAMLLGMLDGFRNTEFWYVDRGILVADANDDDAGSGGGYSSSSFRRLSVRQEDKWWLPCPRVANDGLSEEARKKLQQSRDCANQILKAAMAINSAVLADMAIPDIYLESLPKTGKTCLGDIIYRYITADQYSPECLLDCLDLSSEHHTLEIANRIEAAIQVWRQKDRKKHHSPLGKTKKSWGGKVKGLVADAERNHFLAERANGLLQSLRLRYPGLPQTLLDMNKIQYNKDVGQSILESYSRVMESLAFNIIARIDDIIYVDDAAKKCLASEAALFNPGGLGGLPVLKRIAPSPFSIQNSPYASPFATPRFCSSTPVIGSPGRGYTLPKLNLRKQPEKIEKLVSADVERTWSYTGNVSMRKDSGDAPERD